MLVPGAAQSGALQTRHLKALGDWNGPDRRRTADALRLIQGCAAYSRRVSSQRLR